MNRFFRSALFPLVVIVLLVFLASETLIPRGGNDKKMTYSELQTQTKNGGVESVVFDPRRQQIKATLTGGDQVKLNYPSPQSQVEFERLLQVRERQVRLEGNRHEHLVGAGLDPPADPAPPRLLDLHDESDAGRGLEGDELREEPRQTDVAGLAQDDVQGRRRRRRGGRGAP